MSQMSNGGFDGNNSFRRPRYFDGQFLSAKDFQAEQDYHTGKRRLLNRALYGSGIVSGLEVAGSREDNQLHVNSGLALDGRGNEIYVEERVTVDLRTLLPRSGSESSRGGSSARSRRTRKLCICIQYMEVPEGPVPVRSSGEDDAEESLEFSRYREGFRIDLRPEQRRGRNASACDESDHRVALGIVEIDADGRVVDVCADGCRTHVHRPR